MRARSIAGRVSRTAYLGTLVAAGALAVAGDDGGFPATVYWGDTHVHTAISGDAFLGGTRLGLDDAYRFARGEEVTSTSG